MGLALALPQWKAKQSTSRWGKPDKQALKKTNQGQENNKKNNKIRKPIGARRGVYKTPLQKMKMEGVWQQ